MLLVEQLNKIKDPVVRVHSIRIARSALQDQLQDMLLQSDAKQAFTNTAAARWVAGAIESLNISFPEADDVNPTLPSSPIYEVDETEM